MHLPIASSLMLLLRGCVHHQPSGRRAHMHLGVTLRRLSLRGRSNTGKILGRARRNLNRRFKKSNGNGSLWLEAILTMSFAF